MDEAHTEETIATGIHRYWRDGDALFAFASSTIWDASRAAETTCPINPGR